eukprot:5144418-Amphidinium_carterae.1
MQSDPPPPVEDDLEKLKQKLLQVLSAASQDGDLTAALTDDNKANVRDILLQSADDGRLAAALAEATECDIKSRFKCDLRDLLLSASESGALADILQGIATERAELQGRELLETESDALQSVPPMAELRMQMRDVLLVAADDGSLRRALQEVAMTMEELTDQLADARAELGDLALKA